MPNEANQAETITDPIWTDKRAAQEYGVSVSTFRRGIKSGWFPAGVQLSPGRVGWFKSTIDAHKAQLLTEAAQ